MAEAEPVFAQRPSAERPTYEVGMRWLLNDGAYDLIRATSDVYFFAAGPNRQIQLTRDLGLYRVLKDGRVDWQIDPPPPIKWPLEVGKFGTLFNAILHSREYPSGLPVQLTWQVKAYESVQVPAGAYQAFRILYLAEYIGDPLKRSGAIAGRQSWSVEMWYAPEARQIVKAEGAGLRGLDFQLVAADQSAPAALQVILDDPKDQVHTGSAETMVGGKVTAGAGVARVLATLNGAEIVFNPSATVAGLSEYLWKLEQPAHAVANGYFVGAINRVGWEKPWKIGEFYGQSYFCDPRGKIIAEGPRDKDAVVVADLNLDMIEEVRSVWQFYRDRRPDAYAPLVQP